MAESVGIGIVGVGMMGSRHAGHLAAGLIRHARLAALMDVDPDRLAQAARQFGGVRTFSTAEELVASQEVGGILIAAPDFMHAELALACLDAGKPALVEKPLATSSEDGARVIAAETGMNRRLLQVGFMREFDAAHMQALRAVRNGELGASLVFHGWHRNSQQGGARSIPDVVINSLIHDIHSARWMMGEEIESVFAQVVPDATGAPDSARLIIVQLQYVDGALGLLEYNSDAAYGYEVGVQITCERGLVATPLPEMPLVRHAGRAAQAIACDWPDRFGPAYQAEVNAWVAGIRRGEATGPSAWDGYMAMEVADACVRSARSGEPESVGGMARPPLYA